MRKNRNRQISTRGDDELDAGGGRTRQEGELRGAGGEPCSAGAMRPSRRLAVQRRRRSSLAGDGCASSTPRRAGPGRPQNVCEEGFSRFAAQIAYFPKVSFRNNQQASTEPKATVLSPGTIFLACDDTYERASAPRQPNGKDLENSHFEAQSADFLPQSQMTARRNAILHQAQGETLASRSQGIVRYGSGTPPPRPNSTQRNREPPGMKTLEKHLRTPTSFPKAKRSHTERHSPGEPDVIYPGKRRHTTGRLFTASSQSEASANTTKGFAPFRVTNRCQGRRPRRHGRVRRIWFTDSKNGSGNPKDGDGKPQRTGTRPTETREAETKTDKQERLLQ